MLMSVNIELPRSLYLNMQRYSQFCNIHVQVSHQSHDRDRVIESLVSEAPLSGTEFHLNTLVRLWLSK